MKTTHHTRNVFLAFFGILSAVFFLLALFDTSLVAPGVSMAMAMLAIGNIDDVTDRDTHGSAISYIVYLYHVSQIDRTKPFPQPDEDRKVSEIPLKSTEKGHYFEAHTIPSLVSNTEKGEITTTGTNTFTIIMGGDRNELKDFIEHFSGGKFILVYKHVKESQWHILGELERPMILSNTETKDDADGRYSTFTFTRTSVDLPCLYDADPTGVSEG